MKKRLLTYVFLLGGLLLSSCVKTKNMRITMDMFLKSTSGIKKDIGTAD